MNNKIIAFYKKFNLTRSENLNQLNNEKREIKEICIAIVFTTCLLHVFSTREKYSQFS